MRSFSVSVARIEDFSSNAFELSRNFEVEDGELLGRSREDSTREDAVDDTASILNRDTLASTVPTSVHEISLRTVSFHFLHELLSILSGVEFEERLTEACRESGSRLSDTALCTCEFSSEAREEVVLSLVSIEDRNGRQYTECVSRKEDDVLSSRSSRNRAYDVLDVIDRISYASVFSRSLISEVDLAVSVNDNVFEESVALDSSVDVGFAFLVEVDNLSVATTFEVEDTDCRPNRVRRHR